jgi:hypothetical protein
LGRRLHARRCERRRQTLEQIARRLLQTFLPAAYAFDVNKRVRPRRFETPNVPSWKGDWPSRMQFDLRQSREIAFNHRPEQLGFSECRPTGAKINEALWVRIAGAGI